jgi:hypothetical protein
LLEDSAIRTISSAYKMINNFIKISKLLSSSSEIEFNPGTFSCMKKSSKSFKNNENIKGYVCSPCRTLLHMANIQIYFHYKINKI